MAQKSLKTRKKKFTPDFFPQMRPTTGPMRKDGVKPKREGVQKLSQEAKQTATHCQQNNADPKDIWIQYWIPKYRIRHCTAIFVNSSRSFQIQRMCFPHLKVSSLLMHREKVKLVEMLKSTTRPLPMLATTRALLTEEFRILEFI